MNRRNFLALAAGASAAAALPSFDPDEGATLPIIDTHIHLFDTARAEGVPWPTKQDSVLFHPALPGRYRKLAQPLGIVGAIVVEASPWLEDNQWVLDKIANDTFFLGMVGNLEPGKPDFRKQLDRFQHNPLYRGIRYGNIWDRDLSKEVLKAGFIADLKILAEAGLTLDTANPNPALMAAVLRLADQVPQLRVVIDHLPQMTMPENAAARKAYEAHLKELGKRPQVYVKISEVLRRIDGKVPRDLGFYRARLDELFGIFGEDRVLYGSDWPNSDNWLPVDAGLQLVRGYFTGKGRAVAEKYFWKNSVAAYKWQKRTATQPG